MCLNVSEQPPRNFWRTGHRLPSPIPLPFGPLVHFDCRPDSPSETQYGLIEEQTVSELGEISRSAMVTAPGPPLKGIGLSPEF